MTIKNKILNRLLLLVAVFLASLSFSLYASQASVVFAADQEVSADTDNDGLTDADEIQIFRTDPVKADKDGDG